MLDTLKIMFAGSYLPIRLPNLMCPILNGIKNIVSNGKRMGNITQPKLQWLKNVHIGQNIFIKKTVYDSCFMLSRNGSQFVKNMAKSVFEELTLKNSSVTGKTSNRVKKDATRPPLDPTKLKAIYVDQSLEGGQCIEADSAAASDGLEKSETYDALLRIGDALL
ncbi:hypothetical protein NQ314_010073 [Rhamnusium bicolor]|uniref:BEN domain-containing protein n=1 Tax=Rhamnusium bicolor TaxID=1586634 RepID=A0AAV8XTR2_9CUCU|nr:hypothetical protein NQ314_010073 [Rhamnusium bicolor]